MGKMEETAEKWRGGGGEVAGVAQGMWVAEGCGGMWFVKTGKKWEKWEENGRKYPFFTVPFPLFFLGLKIFNTVPLCKNQLTALTDGNLGNFATPRRSPPQRLVWMLALCSVLWPPQLLSSCRRVRPHHMPVCILCPWTQQTTQRHPAYCVPHGNVPAWDWVPQGTARLRGLFCSVLGGRL